MAGQIQVGKCPSMQLMIVKCMHLIAIYTLEWKRYKYKQECWNGFLAIDPCMCILYSCIVLFDMACISIN